MDRIYEHMKTLILTNLDTISKLVDDAEEMRQSVTTTKDETLKQTLLTQVDKMEESIEQLIKQTKDLFESYKKIVQSN